jgi:alkanesulfonate monooxygenase SsuD/methylene tetrahydromethanopterin reductase-like flavin-dependent oxidoreductase (luciferase family)
MHVGMCAFFQNLDGRHTDREVYRHEIALADLAEPLGFESIWAAEHHFTPYDMCPSTAQFLTYMAGRTRRVRLGSMVVVLPWHDPVRVAEEITVLDHLSDGRVILGLGRGLARVEFEAFRVSMDESRERFVEYADAILGALETGYIEYQGTHYRQPRAAIRPSPFRSFRGRTYVAAVSPESAPIVARFGLGVLIIPQKPWDTTVRELADYRRLYRETNGGAAAPRPLIATFVACHEDGERARAMLETYIRRYCRSTLEHYEFANAGLASIKGYEYYGALAGNIAKHGEDRFVQFLADLQAWGTPDEVYERVCEHQRLADSGMLIAIFSYGAMPHDEARRSMRLFAERVMPRLKARPPQSPFDAA